VPNAAASATPSVAALLARAAGGDRAAFDGAVEFLYDQLVALARAQLRREAVGPTLETGALVHEAYLRLNGGRRDGGTGPGWADRGHFLAVGATAIRRVLVDHARQARVLECRYFAGLTEKETAVASGVGLRTVTRDWAKACAWLRRALQSDAAAGDAGRDGRG